MTRVCRVTEAKEVHKSISVEIFMATTKDRLGILRNELHYSSIASHTKKLRGEVELILEEERIYRNWKGHPFADKAEHEKRKSRLVAIRDELKTLVERQTSTFSRGSVWYG